MQDIRGNDGRQKQIGALGRGKTHNSILSIGVGAMSLQSSTEDLSESVVFIPNTR